MRRTRPGRGGQATRRGTDIHRQGHQTRPSAVHQEHHHQRDGLLRSAQGFHTTRHGIYHPGKRTIKNWTARLIPMRKSGEIMFLAGMTSPDISCSVRELSRRVSSPCKRHWQGQKHVFRYPAGTLDVGINYKKSTDDDMSTLVGYSDSEWLKTKKSEEHHRIPPAHRWITNRVEIKIADVSCNINIGGRVDSNGAWCYKAYPGLGNRSIFYPDSSVGSTITFGIVEDTSSRIWIEVWVGTYDRIRRPVNRYVPKIPFQGGENVIRLTLGWVIDRSFTPVAQ